MNRQQKEAVVSEFKDLLTTTKATFLVGYKGLTVKNLETLRRDLRGNGGVFKITKARLMKIAAQNIEGINNFQTNFKDQVGLVFVKDEVPTIAKTLVEFSKENEQLNVISAFFESKVMSKPEIDFLASLPTKEILLSQVVGSLQAPATRLARILHTMIFRLLYTLRQVSEGEAKN